MKKNLFKVIVLSLFIASITCFTMACTLDNGDSGNGGGGDNPPHTHEFVLKSDTYYHWEECSCGERKNSESHTGGTATCTQKATCAVCNNQYGSFLAHDYTLQVESVQNLATSATCLEPAYYYYTCSCGAKSNLKYSVGAPLNHTFTTYVYDGNATCEQDGTETAHCDNANCVETDTRIKQDSALGHSFGAWISLGNDKHKRTCAYNSEHFEVEDCSGGVATCEEKAICEDCNTEYGEALGHEYGDWISNYDGTHKRVCAHNDAHFEIDLCTGGVATCEEKAVCSLCNVEYGMALGHTYGGWASTGNDKHERICLNDEKHVEIKDCSGGYATCEEKPICDTCNTAYGKALGHDYSEWMAWGSDSHAKICYNNRQHDIIESCYGGKATCEESATCTVCNEKYGNPLGHDYGEWISNGAGQHVRTCSRNNGHIVTENCFGGYATCEESATCSTCKGKYGNPLGHDYGWWISNGNSQHERVCTRNSNHKIIENCLGGTATCTEKATCTVCNEKYGNPLGHDYGEWKPNGSNEHIRTCLRNEWHVEFGEHRGGEATCIALAICTDCKISYGDYGEHNYVNKICTVCNQKKPSEGLEYTLKIDKTTWNGYYAVTGKGTCTDTEVVIPSVYGDERYPVTEIADGAFKEYTTLLEIYIPDSVTAISKTAFEKCTSLTSINVAENNIAYKTIDGDLYSKDGKTLLRYAIGKKVSTLTTPENVENIGEYAFADSNYLISVVVPNSTNKIMPFAFYKCNVLTNLTVPFLGEQANVDDGITLNFGYYSQVLGYIFGYTVTNSSEAVYGATYQCVNNATSYFHYYIPDSLRSVTVTDVTKIKNFAFNNCKFLTSISVPNTVTEIGDSAFKNCSSIKSINIPNNLKTIGMSAFSGCSNLKEIEIPYGVTLIENLAFEGCSAIKQIEIPDSVTTIGTSVFFACNIEEFKAPAIAVRAITGFGKNVKKAVVTSGDKLEDNSFLQCSLLTSVELPSTLTHIGKNAFYQCSTLTDIIIPKNVTCLDYGAFYECESLYGIVIPNNVESIGEQAFFNCISLGTVVFEENSNLKDVGDYAFYRCQALKRITIPNSVKNIGAVSFYGCILLEEVLFEENSTLTRIEHSSFDYCKKLEKIELPNSVKSIATNAFSQCFMLKEVIIGSGVESIEKNAFYDFKNLTSIVIPSNVLYIDSGAFVGRESLTIYCEAESKPNGWNENWNIYNYPIVWNCNENDVANDGNVYTVVDGLRYTLNNGEATLARQALNITNNIIPSSITYKNSVYKVTTIEDKAFYDCESIMTMNVGAEITHIGSWAFSGCTNLTKIVIPRSVTSVGEYVFNNSNIVIYFEGTERPNGWGIYNDYNGNPVIWDCYNNNVDGYGNVYTTINDIAYKLKDGKAIVVRQPVNITSIKVPASITYNGESYTVTEIESYAFYNCTSLTSVELPNTISIIGDCAFYRCISLESIALPSNVSSIGSDAFFACTVLKFYEVNGLKYLGNTSNNYLYLIEVVQGVENADIHENCILIAKGAFNKCFTLISIKIGEKIKTIPDYEFYGCNKLVEVVNKSPYITVVKGSEENGYLGYYALDVYNSTDEFIESKLSNQSGYIIYDSGLEKILVGYNGEETDLTLPNNVTKIYALAFYNCDSLTSIVIPDSVTSIGSHAFYDCSNLTIYCEAVEKPIDWSDKWNYSNCPVIWGYNTNA